MKRIRGKKPVAGAAVGALALSLMPAGAALGQTVPSVCEGSLEGVFEDVPPAGIHAPNIDCLAAYGITEGVGGGLYDPDAEVPRDQMATFLVEFVETALGEELPVPEENFFEDIADSVHTENIRIAAELGITEGVSDTMYNPNQPVTRGQIATFVVEAMRAAGYDWADVNPEDLFTDDENSVHEENINLLAAVDIVSGVSEDEYNPSETLSRAQMASILVQAAEYLSEVGIWAGSLVDDGGEPVEELTVDPVDPVTLGVGANQALTFSGITAGTVDVGLAPCEDVTVAEDGTVSFADADADDAYAFGEVAAADIGVLDGTDVTDADYFDEVDAADSEVVADVTGVATGCTVGVAYEDADDDDLLDLNEADAATEVFGVTGDVEIA